MMNERMYSLKKVNEHAVCLLAVSAIASECLSLICPKDTPRHIQSLWRPPGQTSVTILCCNLLAGESLPLPGSTWGLNPLFLRNLTKRLCIVAVTGWQAGV
jgi:hypothetical protein